jgi:hypothetical protein
LSDSGKIVENSSGAKQNQATFWKHFILVKDPRVTRRTVHSIPLPPFSTVYWPRGRKRINALGAHRAHWQIRKKLRYNFEFDYLVFSQKNMTER